MSARNLVRHLRDSGALDAKPPARAQVVPMILAGAFFGAVMYLGLTWGIPMLLEAIGTPPAIPAGEFARR